MKTAIQTTLKTLPLAVLLAACSFVPQYEQPQVPLDEQWMQLSISGQSGHTAQELGWRDYFQDPQLQALIAKALEHNHDLRTAALSVESAAAQYNIQKAAQLPTVGLSAGATRSRTGADAANIAGNTSPIYSTAYRAAVGINSFELDFFGRVRALTAAQLNTYLKTREARDAAQLAVIKNVAQAYYAARIYRNLMALSQQVLKARQETTRLARLQLQAGVITAVTYKNYEAANESAKADYYSYQRSYEQAVNALSVVVGLPVRQLELPEAAGLNSQFADLRIPAGIPSSVLENRPDIRQAEYQLLAANANIGAAKAALFPTISLTGSAGYASASLENLIRGPNSVLSIGPAISVPIFNRSALKGQVKVSEIAQKQAVEAYQSAVQNAFKEVSDALIARETYAEQYAAAARAVDAQDQAVNLERMRFKAGVTDGLTLIEAERNAYAAEENLLRLQLAILQNMVNLYTAMGGGLNEYGVSLPSAGKAQLDLGDAQQEADNDGIGNIPAPAGIPTADSSSTVYHPALPNHVPAGAKPIQLQ